ncbi:hypothetical protein [Phenylobacterium sp.]|uniref:hypothetical protein n=1 Tax=Phenylobacterium sp. TaxID=1871053 RepID=UPI00273408CF|nr:hypothetical protein [Phenylobacterium sp.]MDP3631988.1 hypothetical protein [Phenylobacterium sp.]
MPLRAIILIGLLVAAGPAMAGNAKCIWDQLPGSNRDAYLLAGLKDHRPDVMDHFSDAQLSVALNACKISDAAMEHAGRAFSGYTGQLIAERRLEILTNVYAKQLDAAWAALDPGLIAALAQEVASGKDTGAGLKVWNSLIATLTPAASDLTALKLELISYMSSRATRQANEKLY